MREELRLMAAKLAARDQAVAQHIQVGCTATRTAAALLFASNPYNWAAVLHPLRTWRRSHAHDDN
jgi:hypothetical protein